MNTENQLRVDIDEFIRRSINDGELLEDVIDKLEHIVKEKSGEWYNNIQYNVIYIKSQV